MVNPKINPLKENVAIPQLGQTKDSPSGITPSIKYYQPRYHPNEVIYNLKKTLLYKTPYLKLKGLPVIEHDCTNQSRVNH